MARNHITQKDNIIKYCIKCNYELITGTNWSEDNTNNGRYICMDCQRKQRRDKYKDNHPHYGEMRRNNVTQMDSLTKYCTNCGHELIIGKNWTKGMQRYSNYTCKKCNNIKCKEWRENNPNYNAIHTKDWTGKNPEKKKESDKNWRNNNQERIRAYRQSEKGKIANSKAKDKRYRCFGYEILFDNPFNSDIKVDYHHISDAFVVVLPRSLHRGHTHGKNTKLHREELKPFVESIYDISYIIEVGD